MAEEKATFEVARAWQDAANRQDAERLAALSAEQIEVVGPRGSGFGRRLVVDWLGRAGLTLTTLQAFARGKVVVLAQHGVWRSAETGVVTGEADLASRFVVEAGQVALFQRYDRLDSALADADLSEADAIPLDRARRLVV